MSDPGTLGPTRLLSQSKRGPVSWSKELTKVANVMFSMREYWLLFTSWTANVPGLIKLAMSQVRRARAKTTETHGHDGDDVGGTDRVLLRVWGLVACRPTSACAGAAVARAARASRTATTEW